MHGSQSPALLMTYFENYLRNQKIDVFRSRVVSRYNQGTLSRLIIIGNRKLRRAAVLALGLIGGFEVNAVVARALRDIDKTVRELAANALWAIWFRADSPKNNAILEEIHDLNNRRRFQDAEALGTCLIDRAPEFAEARNQRAIARFGQDRLAESAEDCRRALELNPYHFGALGGLAQCQLRLGQKDEALKSFQKALKLQPYHQGIRRAIAVLESE